MEAVWVRINDIVIPYIIWFMAGFLEQGVPFRSHIVGIVLCILNAPFREFQLKYI